MFIDIYKRFLNIVNYFDFIGEDFMELVRSYNVRVIKVQEI